MRRFMVVTALAVLGCGGSPPAHAPSARRAAAAGEPSASRTPRPARWAQRVERPGLPNLHRVNGTLWRGAQPSAEGMRELTKLGVRTVVNLRSFHSDRDELGDLPLSYEHLHMKAWHPEWQELVRFLRIATDETRQPVFVHCQHGADRTGLQVAVYRVAVEDWSKDDAIDEMVNGGFGHHTIWSNLVTTVRELDVQRLRREAGLEAP